MKKYLLLVSIFVSLIAVGQSKKTRQALANARSLEHTVFGTKDSLWLEKNFASTMTYGHSSGKIQTRAEAIKGISGNKSRYEIKDTVRGYQTVSKGDSIQVTHIFIATEKKADGTAVPLRLKIVTVWAKENGKMRLFSRRAYHMED
jgi:ketosteroid isomerase-like protein